MYYSSINTTGKNVITFCKFTGIDQYFYLLVKQRKKIANTEKYQGNLKKKFTNYISCIDNWSYYFYLLKEIKKFAKLQVLEKFTNQFFHIDRVLYFTNSNNAALYSFALILAILF